MATLGLFIACLALGIGNWIAFQSLDSDPLRSALIVFVGGAGVSIIVTALNWEMRGYWYQTIINAVIFFGHWCAANAFLFWLHANNDNPDEWVALAVMAPPLMFIAMVAAHSGLYRLFGGR